MERQVTYALTLGGGGSDMHGVNFCCHHSSFTCVIDGWPSTSTFSI